MAEIASIDARAPAEQGGSASPSPFSGEADFPAALLELLHEASAQAGINANCPEFPASNSCHSTEFVQFVLTEGEALEEEPPRQGVPGKRNGVEQRRDGEDHSSERGAALLSQALVEASALLPKANPEKPSRQLMAASPPPPSLFPGEGMGMRLIDGFKAGSQEPRAGSQNEMSGGTYESLRLATAHESAPFIREQRRPESAEPFTQPELSSGEALAQNNAAARGASDFEQEVAEPFRPGRVVQLEPDAGPAKRTQSGSQPIEAKLDRTLTAKGGAADLPEKPNQQPVDPPVYAESAPPRQEFHPSPALADSAARYLGFKAGREDRSRPQQDATSLNEITTRRAQVSGSDKLPLRAGFETGAGGAPPQQKFILPVQGRADYAEPLVTRPLPEHPWAQNKGAEHRHPPLAPVHYNLPLANDRPPSPSSNAEAPAFALLEKFQFIGEIVEQIKLASSALGRDKKATILLELKPEQAGEIYIRAESRDNIISTAIYVRSDELKRSLEINLDLLQSALKAAGLSVDKLEVLSTQQLFSPSLSHGSSLGSQPEDRRHPNSRRAVAFVPRRASDESILGRIETDIARRLRRLEEYA